MIMTNWWINVFAAFYSFSSSEMLQLSLVAYMQNTIAALYHNLQSNKHIVELFGL